MSAHFAPAGQHPQLHTARITPHGWKTARKASLGVAVLGDRTRGKRPLRSACPTAHGGHAAWPRCWLPLLFRRLLPLRVRPPAGSPCAREATCPTAWTTGKACRSVELRVRQAAQMRPEKGRQRMRARPAVGGASRAPRIPGRSRGTRTPALGGCTVRAPTSFAAESRRGSREGRAPCLGAGGLPACHMSFSRE